MAYKLQLKRGLTSALPTGSAGEPLFTTDTNDLYIGTGAANQRYQKYIASGSSSQFLKGDGSLDSTTYQPLLTNPVTGTGTTNQLTKFSGSSTIANSNILDNGTDVIINSRTSVTDANGNFVTITPNDGTNTRVEANANRPLLIATSGASLKLAAGGTTTQITLASTGTVTLANLAGSGTRLVVADANGLLSTQSIGSGVVTGTGTTNYLPKWTSGSAIGNSAIYDNSGSIYVGAITDVSSVAKFLVQYGSDSNWGISINNSYTATANNGYFARFYNNGYEIGGLNAGNASTDLFRLVGRNGLIFSIGASNGSEGMRLTSTGLGIGTTSPSVKMDVIGDIRGQEGRFYNPSATNEYTYIGHSSTGVYLGTAQNKSIYFTNNNTERARIDTSGNLGLGVVPSAWTDYKAFQVNTGATLAANANQLVLGSNWYYNSGDKYVTSDYATIYVQNSGQHKWFNAPSGTAGNAISFTQAMTLGANSGLSIGTTTAAPSNGILTNGDIKNPYAVLRGDALEQWQGASDTAEISINYLGYNSTNTYFRNFSVYNGKSSKIFGIVGSTGAATFSSSVTASGSLSATDLALGTSSPVEKITIAASTSPNLGLSLQPAGWNGAKHRLNVPTSGDTSMWSFNWNGSSVDSALYATSAIHVANGLITFNTIGSANAPTERLRITSGGSVGISTTAPKGLLGLGNQEDLVSTTGITLGSDHSVIEMLASNYSAGYGAKIEQADPGDGATYTRLYGRANTTAWTQNLSINNTTGAATFSSSIAATQFTSEGGRGTSYGYKLPDWQIYNTSSGNALAFSNYTTDLLRITSGGNLLVGSTVDYGTKIFVNGSSTFGGMLNITGSTGLPSATSATLFMASGFSSPDIGRIFVGDGTGWKMYFSKRSSSTTTDLVTFQDNGNVGIGTSSPAYKLDVNGDVKVGTYLYMGSEGSGSVLGDISTGNYLRFLVSNGEKMRITSGGLVGIGNTSPQVPLSVTSSGDNWGVFIGPNAGSTTGKRLKLGYFGTSDYAAIQSINDGTSVTSLVLQKDGGNVGIGTTSPSEKLEVNGNIKATNLLSGTYTPTLTGVYNVASSTAYELQYMRVGNVVTVSGYIQASATASNTWTRISITLPISSTFDYSYRAGGGGGASATNNVCAIQAGAFGTSVVYLDSYPNTTSNLGYTFSFTYLIM